MTSDQREPKPRLTAKLIIVVILCLLIVVALGNALREIFELRSNSTPEFSIQDAWIRPMLTSRGVTAAYGTLVNNRESNVVLVQAQSETIGAIEFHESIYRDGLHSMVRLEQLDIPAEGVLELAPGGIHLMLFRVEDLDQIEHQIEFTSSNGETFSQAFRVGHDQN